MEKKLTTNDMNSLLCHVIKTIDHWWVEKTNLKQGYFTRSKCATPDILYQRYVEWRFALTNDSKEYESLFISLEYENRIDYIRIALKKMKDGVYSVYDPFCEIYDGKTEVVFSERTGFDPDNILHYVISKQDFDELADKIADTVHRFVTSSDEEECDNMSNTTDKKEYGDGMEALTTNELLNVLINELGQLRIFWPNFFNAQFENLDIDDTDTDITFNIDYTRKGFIIDIQNDGFYVCQLEYVWVGDANANMLNINMLNGAGELLDRYKGICMRDNDYPKLNYWDENELKASGYKYLWDFMSRLYNPIQEAMRDKWIKSHEIEEEMKHSKYNGIISRPIFDPQFLEPGALIQIYIKDDSALSQPPGMFKKGYFYNAFVIEQTDYNTKLKVMCIDHRSGERKAMEVTFSVKDVTSGKIEIIRVK